MKTVIATMITISGIAAFSHTGRADSPASQTRSVPDKPALALEDWSAQHPWSVSLHTGIATPYGLIGVEIQRNLSDILAIAVGAGQGLYDQQVAAALRVRWDLGRVALGISLGPGFGDSDNFSTTGDQSLTYRDALWANGEIYAEFRSSMGAFVRSYAGATATLVSDCVESPGGPSTPSCASEPTLVHPVLGLAVGYAL